MQGLNRHWRRLHPVLEHLIQVLAALALFQLQSPVDVPLKQQMIVQICGFLWDTWVEFLSPCFRPGTGLLLWIFEK